MSDAERTAIGIDVGGTKTAALRIRPDGAVVARAQRPTPADDEDAICEGMVAVAREVLDDTVAAIGIAAAGMVEAGTGILRFAPNLAWREASLVDRVRGPLGVPTLAENDNTAAAWGEVRVGAAIGYRHVLHVGVGTGIGGGIVLDGALFRGAHGFAGEIGHVIVEPGGPLCGCGNRGCWEQVASGTAIERAGRAAVERHPHSSIGELAGHDPAAVTGELVTAAARRGDAAARGILMEVGHRLGEGIGGLVNVLDVEVVTVGGGASTAGDLLMAPVRKAYTMSVMAPEHRPQVPVLQAKLGADASGVGAAILALDELT
ncbi:MAG TPA: ROK family protein [Actinomycetota bacterium]|nr:ROK family protein [Actinomycetota bacterium]